MSVTVTTQKPYDNNMVTNRETKQTFATATEWEISEKGNLWIRDSAHRPIATFPQGIWLAVVQT